MFSSQTPPKSRRQSYKTFTKGLLSQSDVDEAALYRAKHSHRPLPPLYESKSMDQLDPDSSADPLQIPPATQRNGGFARPGIPASASVPAHLPSAQLILGEASVIPPRMPRISSTVSSVPLSYAYGAPSTGKEKSAHARAPRTSIGGDGDSQSAASRSSRGKGSRKSGIAGREDDDDAASGSVSIDQQGDRQKDSAQVRYARVAQRLQNTGSISRPQPLDDEEDEDEELPSSANPTAGGSGVGGKIKKAPKPSGASLKGTSVNIATAFEQARFATMQSQPHSVPTSAAAATAAMEADIHNQARLDEAIKETRILSPGSLPQQPQQQESNSKKRKKSRRSHDPSYRYRVGDSASSDSEAGSGIGDKREKRVRIVDEHGNEKEVVESGGGGGGSGRKRPKKKVKRAGGDTETDSQEDTGAGLATSRGRRSLGQAGEADESLAPPAARRKSTGKPKKKSNGKDGEYVRDSADETSSNADTGAGIAKTRPRRSLGNSQNGRTSTAGSASANGAQQASVTYFMARPDSSEPSVAPVGEDTTLGSEYSGPAGVTGESYDYGDVQNMVTAIAEQELIQEQIATPVASPSTQRREPVYRVEQHQASLRRHSQDSPVKPRRTLPVIKERSKLSTPVFRENEDVEEEVEREGEGEESAGAGAKLGRKVGMWVRGVKRGVVGINWWKVAAGVLLFSVLLGATRRDGFSRGRQAYVPPDIPANTFDELVNRLTSLEQNWASVAQQADLDSIRGTLTKDISKLQSEASATAKKAAKNLEDSLGANKKEFKAVDGALTKLKSELSGMLERVREAEAEKKTSDADYKKLKKGMEGINKEMAAWNNRFHKVEQDVATVMNGERLSKLAIEAIENRLPSLVAVRVDPKTGNLDIDPAFWNHLKAAFAEKHDVERSIDSKISSHLAHVPQGGSGTGTRPALAWDDFLASNEKALKAYIENDYSDRATAGGVVSRKEFMERLQGQINSLWKEMEKGFAAQKVEFGQEVAEKLSKLKEPAPTPSSSGGIWGRLPGVGSGSGSANTVTIKTSDGKNVNELIGAIVDTALSRYSKDVLGRRDYALYSAGARINPRLTTPAYNPVPSGWRHMFGLGLVEYHGRPAVTALHPDTSVGMCWSFGGSVGQLGIVLARNIVPTDITIEHASADIVFDVSSAPRDFEIWGLLSSVEDATLVQAHREQQPMDLDDAQSSPPSNEMLIAKGTYVPSSSGHIQTFPVSLAARQLGISFQEVVFRITSNHGNPDFTCLYRVRVHGEEPVNKVEDVE